jgi:hypothetical protein
MTKLPNNPLDEPRELAPGLFLEGVERTVVYADNSLWSRFWRWVWGA